MNLAQLRLRNWFSTQTDSHLASRYLFVQTPPGKVYPLLQEDLHYTWVEETTICILQGLRKIPMEESDEGRYA